MEYKIQFSPLLYITLFLCYMFTLRNVNRIEKVGYSILGLNSEGLFWRLFNKSVNCEF